MWSCTYLMAWWQLFELTIFKNVHQCISCVCFLWPRCSTLDTCCQSSCMTYATISSKKKSTWKTVSGKLQFSMLFFFFLVFDKKLIFHAFFSHVRQITLNLSFFVVDRIKYRFCQMFSSFTDLSRYRLFYSKIALRYSRLRLTCS